VIATTLTITRPNLQPSAVRPRQAGFIRDTTAIAGRALRAIPRDMTAVGPPVFIALFFFVVNIGTLQRLTKQNIAGFNFKAFMMATAILLGVTGVSRAPALVLDVENGYFDRLLLTPVRRLAILLGHMVARTRRSARRHRRGHPAQHVAVLRRLTGPSAPGVSAPPTGPPRLAIAGALPPSFATDGPPAGEPPIVG
jgi:hypothetical protein